MVYVAQENSKYIRWTHPPVIVTIRDNKDYIRVLLNSYYCYRVGGVLLTNTNPKFGGELYSQTYLPAIVLHLVLLGMQENGPNSDGYPCGHTHPDGQASGAAD